MSGDWANEWLAATAEKGIMVKTPESVSLEEAFQIMVSLMKDTQAENKCLKLHAEALAERLETILNSTTHPVTVTYLDEALSAYRSDFPKEGG